MNPFLTQIVIQTTLKNKIKKAGDATQYSSYELAKGYRELMITLKETFKDIFLILIGVFSAAFGFKGFLLTNHFIDGGATGISLLVSQLSDTPLYVWVLAVNVPFIVLGYKVIGKQFAIKTAFAIFALTIVLAMVKFPNVTNDNLLVSIFGGFFWVRGSDLLLEGGE